METEQAVTAAAQPESKPMLWTPERLTWDSEESREWAAVSLKSLVSTWSTHHGIASSRRPVSGSAGREGYKISVVALEGDA